MDATPQATATPADNGGNPGTPSENGGQTANTQTTSKSVDNTNPANPEPFMTFQTQADFDRHSAGILNSAKNKAEKELLALLGLKPDEKDKLAKFKEAYDATLTDAEKKAKELESLAAESKSLKSELAEKDAIIAAITKSTGKNVEEVMKFVKMAKGLVDENTNMEQALEQVFAIAKPAKTIPQGTPPANAGGKVPEDNPFKNGNLTEQGKLIRSDREKAREMYFAVYGKAPSW